MQCSHRHYIGLTEHPAALLRDSEEIAPNIKSMGG